MSKILAVGGPKGGVGKTTVSLNVATNATRLLGLRVLLVDADPNRSASDAAVAAGNLMPFDVAEGLDHDKLVQLHRATQYDLVVIDLPGAREAGALKALLRGEERHGKPAKPAVDGLLLPTRPEIMDLRPLRRVVRDEIVPLGVAYLVTLVRVHRDRVELARRRREEFRDMGFVVAECLTRNLVVHDDALEERRTLLDMPGGRRSSVRAADREYRELTAEGLSLIGIHRRNDLLADLKEDDPDGH
jgi:chromosome partitioning protein